jgi:ABC-type multidrug transport system permease subunit
VLEKKHELPYLFIIDSKNQINTILPSFAHFRKGYISHHDQANPVSDTALIITNT